jgi:hypothetical protein
MAGTLTIRRYQDVEPIIKENIAEFNMYASKMPTFSDIKNGLFKAATIPNMLIEKWLREEGFNWYTASEKERNAKLNSNEYQHLRTRPGKL